LPVAAVEIRGVHVKKLQ